MSSDDIRPQRWLIKMLAMQRELQLRYNNGKNIEDFTDEERMAAIRENVLACTDELHEALAETGWKPWATSNHINREAFHSELVDAWHFFMNLMLHSGMTAQNLYEGYLDKNRRNHQRQEHGYDGVVGKCPGCKRAYDDKGVKCKLRDSWGTLDTSKSVTMWCEVYGYIMPQETP